MAEKKVLTHLNLHKQQLLNAALQVVATPPPAPATGQIYWDTAKNSAFVWTGTAWLDLGQVYTHDDFPGSGQPSTALSGAQIISRITLDNGHVTGVTTRTLTAAIHHFQLGCCAMFHHPVKEIVYLRVE